MNGPLRGPGTDHSHYGFQPIAGRAAFTWPAGKTVSFSIVILLEHIELYPPPESIQAPLSGGVMGSQFPFPNMPLLTQWDYGLRVGLFRIGDLLDGLALPSAIAIDAMTAERYPFIVEFCRKRGMEFIAHGISASRIISGKMSETEERNYIGESLRRIRSATGGTITGWCGPAQSESTITPYLLDEAGLDYVLDWPNDEQPYFMNTIHKLVSLPPLFALDDAYFLLNRAGTSDDYCKSITVAFDRMTGDASNGARSMILLIRPWLTGQPFRIHALETSLSHIAANATAWKATPSEVQTVFRETQAV